MTDVRGYVSGSTGTLADVVESGPELKPVRPAGPESFAPPPTSWEVFRANRELTRPMRMDYDYIRLRDGYAPILDALGVGAGENPAGFPQEPMADLFVTRRYSGLARSRGASYLGSHVYIGEQEQMVVDMIHARRLVEKNFLPGVPDTIDGLHNYFLDQEKARRAAASSVAARSSGFGQGVAGFAGGIVESFHDPVNLFSLPLGGGGKTLLQVAAREALINGAIEAASQPTAAHNLSELGEHLTVGQAAENVGFAAVGSAVFGSAMHVTAAHVPPLLFKAMPESVQRRWADRMTVGAGHDAPLLKDVLGDMDNRELAAFARSTIGERMTPDEKAAASFAEREQELGEASPFTPGPEGDGAHQQSLAETLQALIDGTPRETGRGALLATSSSVALRSPVPVAVPDHPGFDAQWAAIKGNEHGLGPHGEFLTSPAGAIGPAQVMPGTAPHAAQLAGVPFDEHRYRTDAAYNELLGRAYYSEQLQTFGDPAMAAAAYNAGPGSAARGTGLRGALRKAAEHGEPGNWEAYLPHETQVYVADFRRRMGLPDSGADRAVAGGAADDEGLAALRRSADEAESEGLALAAERDRLGDFERDLGGDRAAFEPVPVLKRELFPSETEWADAQAAFHRSLNAPEAAPAGERGAGRALEPEGAAGAERAPGEAVGPFGREFPEAAGDWPATLAALRGEQGGVVPAALDHPEIGKIDLPWGSEGTNAQDGFGLAKLEKYHPEVIAELPEIVRSMGIRKRERGRIQLEGPDHRGAVRLDWDGEARTWLLTAFAKDAKRLPKTDLPVVERGTPPLPDDRRGSMSGRDGSPDRGAGGNIGSAGAIDNPELKAFGEPGGAGFKAQADSLEHDLRLAAADPELSSRKYRPFGDDRQLTLTELFDELDAERDAAAALRACAGGGA